MEITEVRVKKVESENKLRAYVSVTFDDSFVVHSLKVIEGKNGLFVAMPTRKTSSGEFIDIVHPINTEFREKLQEAIIKAYEETE